MTLSIDPKLIKVIALWRSTTHAGEKAAAQARAEVMAAAAGMTLAEAIVAAEKPAPTVVNIFAGFDDWQEARDPGYKARQAAERAEKERARLERRAAIIRRYGSEEAALAPCERELLLHQALAPWRRPCEPPWQRTTAEVDGCASFVLSAQIPERIRDALASAYAMPTTFAQAKAEFDYWHTRRKEIEDVLGPDNYGDSGLDLTAELRLEKVRALVEHELPTRTLRELRDRLRYYDESEVDNVEIISALVRDADVLVAAQDAHPSKTSKTGVAPHPSTPESRDGRIRAALDADPSRSDRDIDARRRQSARPARRWGSRRLSDPSSAEARRFKCASSSETAGRERGRQCVNGVVLGTDKTPLGSKPMTTTLAPRILVPFDRREAITVREAADMAGRSSDTVRRWAASHDLGRPVGGQWLLSKAALRMFLDGDHRALRAYLGGDRASELVSPYLPASGDASPSMP